MMNRFGNPRVINPNSVIGPSANLSARVSPSRPTMSWPARRCSGVRSASKPVA
jgi:hypothetical protein